MVCGVIDVLLLPFDEGTVGNVRQAILRSHTLTLTN